MSKPLNADRYLTKLWPVGEPALIYYVRPGGNDDNDGLTVLTAFATLNRALHFMAIAGANQSVIIDVTGMTGANAIAANEVLNIGGTTLGGITFDFDLAATSPNNFYHRTHRQIRSELVLTTALDVTAQAFDAVSGILQLTVNDALVANALRGKFAVGSALGEYGTIQSNTGGAGPNTIEVANLVGMTLPIAAYEPGATLRFGDAGNFFEQAIYLLAECDWNLQGLKIESNGPKPVAVGVWPNAPVSFTLCDIEGVEVNAGSGHVTFDGCFVNTETYSQDGATVTVLQSVFYDIAFLCHGSGGSGLNEWVGVIIDTCNSFGGGNAESDFSFQMESSRIVNGTSAGVQCLSGNSTLRHCEVENNATSGVVCNNNSNVLLNDVQGTNTDYGVEASYGAIVRQAGGTAVTGAINDLNIGAVGPAAWGATPITDGDQLVRVGA